MRVYDLWDMWQTLQGTHNWLIKLRIFTKKCKEWAYFRAEIAKYG